MPEIITTELKSDLENMYKIAGDIINEIDSKKLNLESDETRRLFEMVKLGLMDIDGILQKDIFNCDYLITKIQTNKI